MDKQEFYKSCTELFEWLMSAAVKTNARTAHVKYDLPGGGHLYFEVRRGSNG